MEVVVAGNFHLPNYSKKENKRISSLSEVLFYVEKTPILADCGKQTDFKDIF